MKIENTEAIIGKVVNNAGELRVQNLFQQNTFYAIAAQEIDAFDPLGSIVQGKVRQGKVHSTQLLASAFSTQAMLYEIAAKYNLSPLFSNVVMAEVEQILANPGVDDESLVDLENISFCTIDGAGTRDLDQALYIDKENSHYCVYYALADAAYYVRPGTALFDEALKRGASYYLPGLMIPMLPRSLCEGLISLNENVLRRAMIFELHLDSSGVCIDRRIYQAKIKSRAKLAFETVQQFLDSQQASLNGDIALGDSLKLLQEVGELRMQLAEERNIVRYRRHEVNVKLGADGCRFVILDRLRNDVEQYNEQLSLLCNVEGARFLKKDDTEDDHVQPIYRVHPHPPETQIAGFEQLLTGMVKIHQLDPARWQWQQNGQTTLADYLKNLPATGALARIAEAIHRQAIMLNVRSIFSQKAAQHYGVGAEVYARFSAPMREIVGVFLHKETLEKLSGGAQELSKNADDVLREKIIKAANQSKTLQRKVMHDGNLLVLNQMFNDDLEDSKKPRPLHRGTVLGIDKSKLYVLLDNPKIEVKVYIRHLQTYLNLSLQTNNEKAVLYQKNTHKPVIRLGDEVFLYVKEKQNDRWVLLISMD